MLYLLLLRGGKYEIVESEDGKPPHEDDPVLASCQSREEAERKMREDQERTRPDTILLIQSESYPQNAHKMVASRG